MYTRHYVIVDYASSPLSDDVITQVLRMLSDDRSTAALMYHFHMPVNESVVGSSVAVWAEALAEAADERVRSASEFNWYEDEIENTLIVNLPDNPLLAAFIAVQMNEYSACEYPSQRFIRLVGDQVVEVAGLPRNSYRD